MRGSFENIAGIYHQSDYIRCDDARNGRLGTLRYRKDRTGLQPYSHHPAYRQDHFAIQDRRTESRCRRLHRETFLDGVPESEHLQPAQKPGATAGYVHALSFHPHQQYGHQQSR